MNNTSEFDSLLHDRLSSPSSDRLELMEERMPYVKSIRKESDIDFVVLKEHVRDAKCSSTTECVLALAGQENLGVECVVSYDLRTSKVDIRWDLPDDAYPGAVRIHNGYLDPQMAAIDLFLLNDARKKALLRGRFPDEGKMLKIVQHRSRVRQVRTQEERDAETVRRHELAELRAAGLMPPATPRPRINPAVPRIALKQTVRFKTVA